MDERKRIPIEIFSPRQLVALDACSRCGECVVWCPVHEQDEKEEITPRAKALAFKRILRSEHGLLRRLADRFGILEKLFKGLWASEEAVVSGETSGYYDEQIAKLVTLFRTPPGREHYEVVFSEAPGTTPK